jgi:cytochrome c6
LAAWRDPMITVGGAGVNRTAGTGRVVAALSIAVLLAACGGDGGEGADDAAAGRDAEQIETGRALFAGSAQPACVSCHALSDAGSTGGIGPNLDTLAPDAARVEQAVRSGPGPMPSFEGELTDAEIDALAAYVEAVTNGG